MQNSFLIPVFASLWLLFCLFFFLVFEYRNHKKKNREAEKEIRTIENQYREYLKKQNNF